MLKFLTTKLASCRRHRSYLLQNSLVSGTGSLQRFTSYWCLQSDILSPCNCSSVLCFEDRSEMNPKEKNTSATKPNNDKHDYTVKFMISCNKNGR